MFWKRLRFHLSQVNLTLSRRSRITVLHFEELALFVLQGGLATRRFSTERGIPGATFPFPFTFAFAVPVSTAQPPALLLALPAATRLPAPPNTRQENEHDSTCRHSEVKIDVRLAEKIHNTKMCASTAGFKVYIPGIESRNFRHHSSLPPVKCFDMVIVGFRYDASDLYKPFNPSSRAARYQAREEAVDFPEASDDPETRGGGGKDDGDDHTERPRKPIDEVGNSRAPNVC